MSEHSGKWDERDRKRKKMRPRKFVLMVAFLTGMFYFSMLGIESLFRP